MLFTSSCIYYLVIYNNSPAVNTLLMPCAIPFFFLHTQLSIFIHDSRCYLLCQFYSYGSIRTIIKKDNVTFAINGNLLDRVFLGAPDDFNRVRMDIRVVPGHKLPIMTPQYTLPTPAKSSVSMGTPHNGFMATTSSTPSMETPGNGHHINVRPFGGVAEHVGPAVTPALD